MILIAIHKRSNRYHNCKSNYNRLNSGNLFLQPTQHEIKYKMQIDSNLQKLEIDCNQIEAHFCHSLFFYVKWMQINTYIATFGFGLDIPPILHLRNLGSDLQWCLSWYYSWAPWYVHTPPTQNEEIALGHLPMLETRAGKLECRQKCKFGTNALLLSRFCNVSFELRIGSPLLITRNAEHLIISAQCCQLRQFHWGRWIHFLGFANFCKLVNLIYKMAII